MYLSYVSPQQYIMSSLFWWKTFILMSKATRRLKKSVKLNICNVIKKKIFQYFTVLFSDQRLLVYLWMCVIHVLLFKSVSIYSYKLWIFRYRQCCSAKAGFDSIKMAVQAHRRVPKHFFFWAADIMFWNILSLSLSLSSRNGCGRPLSARANFQ